MGAPHDAMIIEESMVYTMVGSKTWAILSTAREARKSLNIGAYFLCKCNEDNA